MRYPVMIAPHCMRGRYYRVFHRQGLLNGIVCDGGLHMPIGCPKWQKQGNPGLTCIGKYVDIKGQRVFLHMTFRPKETQKYYLVHRSQVGPDRCLGSDYYQTFIKMAPLRITMGIINLGCFSLNAMTGKYAQGFMSYAGDHEIGQRHGDCMLAEMEFVLWRFNYLREWLGGFLPVRNQYSTMHWEGLIISPKPTIRPVGRAIGLDLSDAETAETWKSMDHKNLSARRKQNYRKGKSIAGDWKDSTLKERMAMIGRRDMDFCLEQSGRPAICELNPGDCPTCQKLVARDIASGEIRMNTGEPDFSQLAIKKSIVYAGKVNSKTLEPSHWAHAERSTVENHHSARAIADAAGEACNRANALLQIFLGADKKDNSGVPYSSDAWDGPAWPLARDRSESRASGVCDQIFRGLRKAIGKDRASKGLQPSLEP